MCLLGERDLAKKGVPVTFFGEPTRMPAGPAKLAIDTGAPLLPVHCWFTPDGWGFKIDPPIDVSGGVGRPRRHLPTVSRSTSQRTPLTGTCFNRCGARTFPNRGSPAWRVNENRHDLPVLLRRPGGVQAHVVDLAEVLIERGHKVSVLAPSSDDDELPDFVVSAGKAVAIPYNGSVARLSFGPTANNRLRKFIAEGDFDVLHIHEPNAPSLSMLALRIAEGRSSPPSTRRPRSRWC